MNETWIEDRGAGERRGGGDRRGSGARGSSAMPRPYGFRRFDDRRRHQPPPGEPSRPESAATADETPAVTISLTHADLRALLRWLRP